MKILKRLFKKTTPDVVLPPPDVVLPSQQDISDILEDIREHKSYYAGGTLCVDNVVPDDVLMLNLNGEYFLMSNGHKDTLNLYNRSKLFSIYKDVKGETDYYKTKLNTF